jgi:hypothetical protein
MSHSTGLLFPPKLKLRQAKVAVSWQGPSAWRLLSHAGSSGHHQSITEK